MNLKQQIIGVLKHGREQAQTKAAIAKTLDTTTRAVEHAIRELIVDDGYLIGSACKAPFGYFILSDEAEIKRYRNQLISRIKSLSERLRAVELPQNLNRQLNLL